MFSVYKNKNNVSYNLLAWADVNNINKRTINKFHIFLRRRYLSKYIIRLLPIQLTVHFSQLEIVRRIFILAQVF